ncbi:MAG: hypothetical protein AB7H71_06215 [Alphaproteobacteria bacterium]
MAVLVLLALAGCGPSDRSRVSGSGSDEMRGWSFASGKRPSRAEYAAIVASCEQGAVRSARGKKLEDCLADLGLRRD